MQHFCLNGLATPVSRAGMGGCPLGGHGWGDVDDQESIQAVRAALDLGVNFFDTADIYGLGRSESILAEALGEARHRVAIATKFGVRRTPDGKTFKDIRPAYVREALDASLRRLQIESIALYYIHWPDGSTPVEDAVAELERQRQAGKIQAIGVSNFSPAQLAASCGVATIATAQVLYSLVDRQLAEELLPVAIQHNVPLVTWGSLAQGLLTGKFTENPTFGDNDRRQRYENFGTSKFAANLRLVEELKVIAQRLGRTPAQVALRWLLDTPGIGAVLFGAKRPSQVHDNAAAANDWQLSTDDYNRLAAYDFEVDAHRQAA